MEVPHLTIDWESPDSMILINPAYPDSEKVRYQKILEVTPDWPGHLWVSTSGTASTKWVGLSKPAVLSSALAVNEHLGSTDQDRWVYLLPEFHVGGIGILARSYLSGATVLYYKEEHPGKWHPQPFVDYINAHRGTLTSLVPAQLFDIVHSRLRSPSSLRAVIIGGGRLDVELYHHAVELGWKVLPSYGLSECASQVATAEMGSWEKKGIYPRLKILPHLQVKEVYEHLAFAGQSVLSLYALLYPIKPKTDSSSCLGIEPEFKIYNPKIDGWFISEDRGSCQAGYLTVEGRTDSIIKIGGENSDLNRLEAVLQEVRLKLGLREEMTLVPYPDERLGAVIHLVVVDLSSPQQHVVQEHFNKAVLPFEKIRATHTIGAIPKTPLSKVIKKELLELIR